MCGLVGLLAINDAKPPSHERVMLMANTLVHRGPDGRGIYLDKSCALGHRRLSIIDIEGGAQPMVSRCKRWAIAYNGEIYNYRDLTNDLLSSGEVFSTRSDTEVLLLGLARYGPEFLSRVNGIFSLALWDGQTETLLISRDHAGIKPLYYIRTDDYFIFASEQKAIFASELVRKDINRSAMFEYFCRGTAPYGDTLFSGVGELEPGKWLRIGVNGRVETGTFYSMELEWMRVDDVSIPRDEQTLVGYLDDRMKEVVKRQMTSDVPVGIFLSGGIDSGVLLSHMCELTPECMNAFTYANPKGVDESEVARQLILTKNNRINHHIKKITLNDYLAALSDACYFFDEPILYPSSLPLLELSRLARDAGIKVVLGGQGADELFLGYVRYEKWRRELMTSSDIDHWTNVFYFGGGIDNISVVEAITATNREIAESSQAWNWIRKNFFLPPLKRMSIYDQRFRLNGLLKRDDRMGMGAGVECRVPFLDAEFMALVNAIPDEQKIRVGAQKYLLRSLAQRYLPKTVLELPKRGSPTEFEDWIVSPEFSMRLRKLISRHESFSRNCLDMLKINEMLDEHDRSGKYSFIIWCLFSIENWYAVEFEGCDVSEFWGCVSC